MREDLFLRVEERVGGRIHRKYTLRDDWGLIGCRCHTQSVLGLVHKSDQIEEISKKELYDSHRFLRFGHFPKVKRIQCNEYNSCIQHLL